MCTSEGRPVLVINGLNFDSFEGFAEEFSKLLDDHKWQGNLDAFNDLLRGGYGTPDGGFVLRWENSDRSRSVLGHEATALRLEGLLTTCHPTNVSAIRGRLRHARLGRGPTLFDEIVEIIRYHASDGHEANGIDLRLV